MRTNCLTRVELEQVNDNITLAEVSISKKEFPKAIQYYQAALNFLKQYQEPMRYRIAAKIWFDLGFNVYNELKHFQKEKCSYKIAIHNFEKISNQDLDHNDRRLYSVAHWNLAETCLQLNDQNSYAMYVQKALSLFKDLEQNSLSESERKEVTRFNQTFEKVKADKAALITSRISDNKSGMFAHNVAVKPSPTDLQSNYPRLGRKLSS